MANYPGSVVSFATRSNGQTIADTWFNGLQDEVTAIEDGIRNGTAPLNSSNSTLAALSVTGGSSFTGSIVGSSLLTLPNQPRFSGYSTTAQVLSSASTSVLNILTEDYDVGGFHSTSATPSRVTVPSGSSGVYMVTGSAAVQSTALANVRLYLRKNGADVIGDSQTATSTSGAFIMRVATIVVLDAADFLELAGAPQTDPASFGNALSQFAIRLTVAKIA
jgi:hypothetical protein